MSTEGIWKRAREGEHTAAVGLDRLEPPSAPPICAVQVSCAHYRQPLGPLLAMRDALSRLVEETRSPLVMAGTEGDTLRRRLIAEGEDDQGNLVSLAERLRRQLDCPLVMVLEHAEAIDPSSAGLLQRLVTRSELPVPLLLVLARPPAEESAAARLVAALRSHDGDSVVEAEERGGGEPNEPGPAAGSAPPVRELLAGQSDELSINVVRVLRAAAVVGNTFESAYVAALVGVDPLTVLELVQLARDRGIPLEDLGDGVFRMPPAFGDELRVSVMPSLASAWHQQLAQVLGGEEPSVEATAMEAAPAQEPAGTPEQRADASAAALAAALGAPDSAGTFEAEPRMRSSAPSNQPAAPSNRPSMARRSEQPARTDPADRRGVKAPDRAARHAEAAGDVEGAASRFVEAARQAASVGAFERAHELLERALHRLGPVVRPRTRLLRIEALAELGRVRWKGAGDESYNLDAALEALDEAIGLLRPSDPVGLRAELPVLVAHVCYEIGGEDPLGRALLALGEAHRLLRQGGREMDAARLLNDEAAVRVRLGQHDRAAELLLQSRQVFKEHADSSAVARLELAETDHLVARLMLHTPEEGRRDTRALGFATDCARAADRRYAELDDQRERARVWETLGRLQLLVGRTEDAMAHLRQAVEAQQRHGDMLGLARSTQALAGALTEAGLYREALEVLADSVSLNRRKGSRQGLAYNREALEGIASQLDEGARRKLGDAIDELRTMLE